MEQYLIFFHLIGTTSDYRYIYQLDFSDNPESAWGNGWAECPASNVRHMEPEENFITSSYKITTKYNFSTADRNNCFSMQDCIDGIIPLAFCIEDGEAIIFNFNNGLDDVLFEMDSLDIPYEELSRKNVSNDNSSLEKLVGTFNEEEEDNDE